jgi:hypothetical protein
MSRLRVSSRAIAALIVVFSALVLSPLQSGAVTIDPPHLLHVPTMVAPYGASIDIVATGRCATATCSMVLGYRSAEGFSGVDAATYFLNPGGPFTVDPMSVSAALDLPDGSFARTFTGAIPEAVVTTEGVDYYLELTDNGTTTRSPVLAEALGDPGGELVEAFGFHHAEVLSRPTVTHLPRVSYAPGDVIAVEAVVTSSTGMPQVTLKYGLSGGTGRWQIPMTLRTTAVDVNGVASAWVARASIPSSFTRQGGIIAYTVTADDGFQQASSPPLDGTFTVGHLVAPLGLPL